jgi:hemerythrin-like domain-containing protein
MYKNRSFSVARSTSGGRDPRRSRREWLGETVGAGVALAAGSALVTAESPIGDEQGEDVAPPEDLMREHGVLKRILLVYDEVGRRIAAKQDFPPETVRHAADIIRTFIEDYHEKLEEDYLFPRFEKAGKLSDLTRVLREQHQAGRRLTARILQLATPAEAKRPESAVALRDAMAAFARMYAPHEAREDTVLFPAIRSVVSKKEFESLGDEFENKERSLFGEDGFEKMVDRVAEIETTLGIYDLSQFTPR